MPGKHGAGDPALWRMKRQTAGNRGAQSYGGYGGRKTHPLGQPGCQISIFPNLYYRKEK